MDPSLDVSTWEQEVASSDSVVICRLADKGYVSFSGPGTAFYEDARFDVTSPLKGGAPQSFTCTFRVDLTPERMDPRAVLGDEYLALGNFVNGKFELSELVVATPADVQKVRQLTGHTVLSQNTTTPPPRPLQDWRGASGNTAMKLAPESAGARLPEEPSILAQGTSPTVLWLVGTLMIVAFFLLLRLLMRSRRQRG